MSHLNLYLVQDDDRPLYVLAQDWNDALRGWQLRIRRENDLEPDEVCQPDGVQLVARADEIILPAILPIPPIAAPDDDDDDGCPVGDPDCYSREDECHTACERPAQAESHAGGHQKQIANWQADELRRLRQWVVERCRIRGRGYDDGRLTPLDLVDWIDARLTQLRAVGVVTADPDAWRKAEGVLAQEPLP